jgi:hypothetical protein
MFTQIKTKTCIYYDKFFESVKRIFKIKKLGTETKIIIFFTQPLDVGKLEIQAKKFGSA